MDHNQQNNSLDFKEVVRQILDKWKMFGVFLFAAAVIAVLYVKLTPKTYKVGSVIEFKTDDSKKSVKDGGDYLEGYDIINREKLFQNEVTYYRSTPIIKQVVQDLKLEVSYFAKTDKLPFYMYIGLENIYKQTPFQVLFDKTHLQPISTLFYIDIIDNETFYLYAENVETDLYSYEEDRIKRKYAYFNLDGQYKFGEQIEMDDCSFTIVLNSNYNQEFFSGQNLYFSFNSLEGLALGIRDKLNVRATSLESTIAEVSFTWQNPELAIDFLNNLTQKYIDINLEAKTNYANKTLEYIDLQLSNMSDSLGFTGQQLQDFRASHGILQIASKSEQLLTDIQELQAHKLAIIQSLSVLESLQDVFQDADSRNIIVPSAYGLEDAGILPDLLDQLNELKAERDLIKQSKSPRLTILNASIDNLIITTRQNIQFNIDVNNKTLADIESQISQKNREVSLLPQTERKLLDIERKFNLTDAAYTSLLEKRMQAQIAKASTQPDCEVIEPTRFISVASPNVKLILIAAIFLGGFIPLLIVLFKNFFSKTVDRIVDIPSFAKERIVGFLSFMDKKTDNIVNDLPRTHLAEAFYILRSNLRHKLKDETNKVILITSSVPNEGKSFSTLNLATSFAKAHDRVILLDFDLRKDKPLLGGITQGNAGLSRYLIGESSLEDIIQTTQIENLDYIHSGETPANAIELLSSPRIGELIEVLKAEYDYVIIDTPPYGLLTDAFLLMRYSDINLYMIRTGISLSKTLELSCTDLVDKNIENVYFLVNSSRLQENKGYYYKGSYYGEKPKKKFGIFPVNGKRKKNKSKKKQIA